LTVPQSTQPRGPRILIGGGGERRTLRLVAQYADMWNGFGDVPTIRRKLDILGAHCRDVGRDPREITKTRLGTLILAPTREEADRRRAAWQRARNVDEAQLRARLVWGDSDGAAEQARELLEAGLDGLIFNMPPGSTPDEVAFAGEALSSRLSRG
jgi:alkanesulfonate monooxygenase SsuD/methylene tetrahydromethanopterin reductase-like flavin-dependent oxidoreductase (luciferase family)